MRFVPSFTYGLTGDEQTLALSLSQRLWSPEEGVALGHEAISVAGIPFAEWLRYDHAVAMTARFTDDEYLDVMSFIEFTLRHKHIAIELTLDQGNPTSVYDVYMEEPSARTRVKPQRSTSAPWTWEIDLVFRTVDGTRVHLPLLLPPPTVALDATDVTATSFQANWEASPHALSYRLDVATDENFAALVAGYDDLAVDGTSTEVIGLDGDTEYFYRVRVVDRNGASADSNVIAVTTDAGDFLFCTFDDGQAGVALEAYVPTVDDIGADFTEHPSFMGGTARVGTSNDIYMGTSGGGAQAVELYASAVPPTADYTVEAVWRILSSMIGEIDGMGIWGRGSTVAITRYTLWFNNFNSRYELYKTVAGVDTLLGTSTVNIPTTVTQRTVRLVMDGTDISVYADGVQIIAVVDAAIAGPGSIGLRFFNNTVPSNANAKLHMSMLRGYSNP